MLNNLGCVSCKYCPHADEFHLIVCNYSEYPNPACILLVSAKVAFKTYRQDILQATAGVEPKRLMEELMERKVIDEFSLAEVLTKDKEQSHMYVSYQKNFQRDMLWDAVEEELGRDQKKLMCLRDVLEAITKETRERDSLVMKLDNFNCQYCIDCLMCIMYATLLYRSFVSYFNCCESGTTNLSVSQGWLVPCTSGSSSVH